MDTVFEFLFFYGKDFISISQWFFCEVLLFLSCTCYWLYWEYIFIFSLFLALFNLYVHTLTFLYYPSNLSEEGISMTDMEQLNDEEEGEENVERDGGESGFDSASIWWRLATQKNASLFSLFSLLSLLSI